MKNKTVFGLVLSAVCVAFSAGGASAAGFNGEESFAGSLAPSALALVELPKAAQPAMPSILPLPKDSFSYLTECRIVDAKFIRQPSIPEGVQMLSGCMKQVSKQYKVVVKANVMVAPWGGPGGGAQGSSLSGIILSVVGKVPAGNPVMEHLAYSLEKRNNQLFGHAAMVSASRVKSLELSDKSAAGVLGPLKAAVKGAQRKELEEMGYIVGMDTYPAKTKTSKILADITGWDEADITASAFVMSSGDKAVRSFCAYLREEARSEEEDTLPQSSIIGKNLRNVAAEAEKAFLGAKQYAGVQLAGHSRQEDGDMDHQVLIVQEKDGSFQVLQYMRNPY